MPAWSEAYKEPDPLAEVAPDSPFAEYKAAARPGELPETALPEAHPDIDFMTRLRIKGRGGDPGPGKRLLEEKGFEAVHIGGSDYAVRRPGEAQWRQLEKPGAELQDITDVAGDVLSLFGTAGGAILGSPGGVAGGVGGAALGSAGAQGLRSLLTGLPATSAGEAIGEIGREAAIGAASQGLGAAVGGAARGLRGASRGGRLRMARAEHLAKSGRKAGQGRWKKQRARGEAGRFLRQFDYIPPKPTARQAAMAGRLGRLGERLEAPQRMLEGVLGSGAARALRSPLGRGLTAGAGLTMGGPVGTAVGVSGIAGGVGRGMTRAAQVLMEDTSGRPLMHLFRKASGPVADKIEKVLAMAGTEGMSRSYMAGVWSLLHDPDFRELLRGEE